MINQAGLDLIKEFEGLRLTAYQDSVGVWTIGYGTTSAAGVGIAPHEGMAITQAQAEGYLKAGINKFAGKVLPMLTHPATPNQFAAMVSLAYNIGPGNFAKSSVLRKFNAGDTKGAAASFALWNKAGGKPLAALTRRRSAEAALFLMP
jgi:lysozyme